MTVADLLNQARAALERGVARGWIDELLRAAGVDPRMLDASGGQIRRADVMSEQDFSNSNLGKEMGIRIHPAGQGRVTDWELVNQLTQITPLAFRKAQDVVVAAKKYVAGPGLPERSLIQRLQKEVYELHKALIEDNYKPTLNASPVEFLFSYISEFSDAFPNWQREYDALNRFIPLCF